MFNIYNIMFFFIKRNIFLLLKTIIKIYFRINDLINFKHFKTQKALFEKLSLKIILQEQIGLNPIQFELIRIGNFLKKFLWKFFCKNTVTFQNFTNLSFIHAIIEFIAEKSNLYVLKPLESEKMLSTSVC